MPAKPISVDEARISHMSHIEREQTLVLTATKASRKPYKVRPLAQQRPTPASKPQDAHEPKPDYDDTTTGEIGAPALPLGEETTIQYVGTTGAENVTPAVGVRKLRAAHRSSKVNMDQWAELWMANKGWLEEHDPDAAAELSVRGEA